MTAIWTINRYLTSTALGLAFGRGLVGSSDGMQAHGHLHGKAPSCLLDSLNP